MRSAIQSVTLLVTVIALSQYALVTLIGGGVVQMIALEAFPLYSGNSLVAAKEATIWLLVIPFLIYFVQLILLEGWVQVVRRLLDGRYDSARMSILGSLWTTSRQKSSMSLRLEPAHALSKVLSREAGVASKALVPGGSSRS